jgi:hypothetical protein
MERNPVNVVVIAGRCLLVCVTFAAASEVVAQPRDSAIGAAVESTRRPSNNRATSTLLTQLESVEPPRVGSPPANLEVSGRLVGVVERMWRHSPTFRRQCAHLGSARLSVTLGVHVRADHRFRALSQVHIDRGAPKRADVQINFRHSRDAVELVAHELEHLIELLDGVELTQQLKRGAARLTAQDHYETLRAVEVGRRVAREVRAQELVARKEHATRGK